MVLAGGSPQPGQAHISELALAIVGPCWVLTAPAPYDTDGPAGSARWPFFRLGFRSVRGW